MQSYLDDTGTTFPMLRQAGYLTNPGQYGISHSNYVVIDTQGIVRYTSIPDRGFNDANIRAAIRENLPMAVRSETWSGIKALYTSTPRR